MLLFQIPGDLPRARDFSRWGSHTPLSHLQTAKLGALEQRWESELAQFDYEIVYRPGRLNAGADVLSNPWW